MINNSFTCTAVFGITLVILEEKRQLNKDENAHRFVLSWELLEREKERERKREKECERERERERKSVKEREKERV